MDVYTKLTDLTSRYKGIVVALGMFDGVHIGHQSIVRRAVSLAREQGGTAMVFTFSNHPLAVLAPQALPPQIAHGDAVVGSGQLALHALLQLIIGQGARRRRQQNRQRGRSGCNKGNNRG